MSHEQAVLLQKRHEAHLMSLPGVTAVSVVLRDEALVLEVSVDPDAALAAELTELIDLDGLPVHVVRQRYKPL